MKNLSKAAKELGMYRLEEGDAKVIIIGDVTMIRQDENSVWIQRGDGDGGAFSNDLLEKAIVSFYDKNL